MMRALSDIIKITPQALEYLKEKGKTDLNIGLPEYRAGGETIMLQLPEIQAKVPKHSEQYHKVTIDGINVYVARNLKPPEENDIVIDIDSVLKFRMLKVSGFNLED